MPNAYVLNQLPTGYGSAMSLFAEMLVQAGWTYQSSGDGLAGYSATGKVFIGTGSGALGWNNAKAWARIQDPQAKREFILQHDAAGGTRFKYSAASKFTAGAPSATITPSAIDEKYLRGGATDAAPTYGAAFFHATVVTAGVKFQGLANADAPYGFWFAGAPTPGGLPNLAFVMDPVSSVPQDPDPVVLYISGSNTANAFMSGSLTFNSINYNNHGGVSPGSFAFMDVGKTQFVQVLLGTWAVGGDTGNGGTTTTESLIVVGSGLPAVSTLSAKPEALPIPYMRPATSTGPYGLKGWSTLMRWTGVKRTTFSDTLDNRKWIAVGNVWLPWDGLTIPTI